MAFEMCHPDAPWLTAQAIYILDQLLRKTDNGIEYGSGRSTIWFAKRTNWLMSIEGNPHWYAQVSERIRRHNLNNVTYKYIKTDRAAPNTPGRHEYVIGDENLEAGSLDYALVDGYYRDGCVFRALELLRPGGVLILDNSNWFAPHETRSPGSVAVPPNMQWREFLARVASWRKIWTSNGISDTTIWFKSE